MIYFFEYRYSRIQIFKVLNVIWVEIFFVDYGEFYRVKSNTLLTIPPYLLTLLPFQVSIIIFLLNKYTKLYYIILFSQAIECSLSGIKTLISGLDLVDSKFKLTRGQLNAEVSKLIARKLFKYLI